MSGKEDYEQIGSGRRELILNKGGERYIFRYEAGNEDELLDALIEAAKSQRTNFDWFDAAVLSFKLTPSLIMQADELLNQTGLEKRAGEQP